MEGVIKLFEFVLDGCSFKGDAREGYLDLAKKMFIIFEEILVFRLLHGVLGYA